MVTLMSLWLPILLSAVFIFVWSSISHMVIKLHKGDYDVLPNEGDVAEAMRKAGIGPGNYVYPHPGDGSDMGSPEMMDKYKQGPVCFVNVVPNGPPNMAKYLGQWFVYTVIVGIFIAYLTSRTLGPGADYLQVFRVSGTATFLVYSVAAPIDSIWKGQRWSTSVKHAFDGLAYSLLTGGAFGWLWP